MCKHPNVEQHFVLDVVYQPTSFRSSAFKGICAMHYKTAVLVYVPRPKRSSSTTLRFHVRSPSPYPQLRPSQCHDVWRGSKRRPVRVGYRRIVFIPNAE